MNDDLLICYLNFVNVFGCKNELKLALGRPHYFNLIMKHYAQIVVSDFSNQFIFKY